MDRIVHHASPSAIGQSFPAVSGNTYAGRPTRYEPQACDCCNKPTTNDFRSSQRGGITCAFGELPYVLCFECLRPLGNELLDEQRTRAFALRRAARFGEQWYDAVKAQLGWQA